MIVKDPRHWATTDGHHYVSIPTRVPTDWRQKHSDSGLIYIHQPYVIRRDSHGSTGYSYTLLRDGVEIGLPYRRLRDAKAHAVRNAEGRDEVHVA
jgi:hypothetical protein